MTPLLPTPDHYLQNLITMTSSEAKRLWRQSIKEHFDCTCVYCGETYDINELTLDHVLPRSSGGDTTYKNIVPACSKCNQEKGSRHWKTFMHDAFGFNGLREHMILKHIH